MRATELGLVLAVFASLSAGATTARSASLSEAIGVTQLTSHPAAFLRHAWELGGMQVPTTELPPLTLSQAAGALARTAGMEEDLASFMELETLSPGAASAIAPLLSAAAEGVELLLRAQSALTPGERQLLRDHIGVLPAAVSGSSIYSASAGRPASAQSLRTPPGLVDAARAVDRTLLAAAAALVTEAALDTRARPLCANEGETVGGG